MKDEGYEFLFDNKICTIFSASAYARVNDNKAAILKFTHAKGYMPEPIQFYGSIQSKEDTQDGYANLLFIFYLISLANSKN